MVARGYEITNIVEALRVGKALAAGDFEAGAWKRARASHIARYWSGEDAPRGRRAEARVAWDAEGFTVRFDCRQTEPLVVSDAPRLAHLGSARPLGGVRARAFEGRALALQPLPLRRPRPLPRLPRLATHTHPRARLPRPGEVRVDSF